MLTACHNLYVSWFYICFTFINLYFRAGSAYTIHTPPLEEKISQNKRPTRNIVHGSYKRFYA